MAKDTVQAQQVDINDLVDAARAWHTDYQRAAKAWALVEGLVHVRQLTSEAEVQHQALLKQIEQIKGLPAIEQQKADIALQKIQHDLLEAMKAAQQQHASDIDTLAKRKQAALNEIEDALAKAKKDATSAVALERSNAEKAFAEARTSFEAQLKALNTEVADTKETLRHTVNMVDQKKRELAREQTKYDTLVALSEARLTAARAEYDKIKESLTALTQKLG